MPFDVERARRDTPGCENVLHFNNAGASLMPRPVVDALLDHIKLEADIGGYEAADRAHEQREVTYGAIADLLNASPEEVALTDSATRAWNMAFYGLRLEPGSRILTSRSAYASNFIAYLNRSKQSGVRIDVAPADESGQIDVDALSERIDDDVALIALTHVPGNNGLVNPAEDVGRIARAHDIPFLLDACQSAGQLPIDVQSIGCDMLSAAGRKFLRVPRGTGFLYVREGFMERLEPPTPDLHSAEWTSRSSYRLRDDARRFELWESNIAGDIALGAAVAYALSWGMDAIRDRVQRQAAMLRSRLAAIDGVTVRDTGRVRGGIVTFDLRDRSAADAKEALRASSMNVTVSAPSTTLLDADDRRLPDMVRASVHYYNSDDEIERFCEAVRSLSSNAA